MYSVEELRRKNMKELLSIGKELNVTGRWDMTKSELITEIMIESGSIEDCKDDCSKCVINEIAVDKEELIKEEKVVFKNYGHDYEEEDNDDFKDAKLYADLAEEIKRPKSDYINNIKKGMIVAFKINEERTVSGMIDEINSNGSFMIKTKNGIRFSVWKKDIIWVKTGSRWPKGVYYELKGENINEH